MKRITNLAIVLLCMSATIHAQNTLTVADTNIPQGGQGEMTVSFQFANEGEITAYQFYLALPEGISLVPNGSRYAYEKGDGYTNAHSVSINYVTEQEVYRVTCACVSQSGSLPFTATSGTLLKLPIQANESLVMGTSLNAGLSNVFLSTVGGSDVPIADVSFRIVIGEASDIRTELFETSTTAPEAASNVNVRVYRTINANEWSTICLPFAMTEAQVTAAFGNDVLLGDFTGCTVDDNDNIAVNFTSATAIQKNHPYVIKVSADVTEFSADGVDIDPQEAVVEYKVGRYYDSFIGNYVNGITIPDYGMFLYNDYFYFSTGLTKIKAYRAYFDFAAAGAEYANSNESRMVFVFDEQTGISDTKWNQDDEDIYSLNGQRVEVPAKGVYVKNGKKVIIK